MATFFPEARRTRVVRDHRPPGIPAGRPLRERNGKSPTPRSVLAAFEAASLHKVRASGLSAVATMSNRESPALLGDPAHEQKNGNYGKPARQSDPYADSAERGRKPNARPTGAPIAQ